MDKGTPKGLDQVYWKGSYLYSDLLQVTPSLRSWGIWIWSSNSYLYYAFSFGIEHSFSSKNSLIVNNAQNNVGHLFIHLFVYWCCHNFMSQIWCYSTLQCISIATCTFLNLWNNLMNYSTITLQCCKFWKAKLQLPHFLKLSHSGHF